MIIPLREKLVAANVTSLARSATLPRFGVTLTRGTSSVWGHFCLVDGRDKRGAIDLFLDPVDLTLKIQAMDVPISKDRNDM